MGFGDIFESFFGGGFQVEEGKMHPQKGDDIEIMLKLTLKKRYLELKRD